jgi:hypothetical protein
MCLAIFGLWLDLSIGGVRELSLFLQKEIYSSMHTDSSKHVQAAETKIVEARTDHLSYNIMPPLVLYCGDSACEKYRGSRPLGK